MTIPRELPLEPIESSSLKDQAYSRIKRLILSGYLSPGEALPLGELSSQLGISRTPVRDAILELERDHLVTSVPYKGTYVAELSPERVEQIFQVRGALEALAVRLATPRIPDRELQEVKALFDALDADIQNASFGQYHETDVRLHQLIIEHSGNLILKELLTRLSDRIHRVRRFSGRQGLRHLEQSFHEHALLLDALVERDVEEAGRLMAEHIENAGKRIAALFQNEME